MPKKDFTEALKKADTRGLKVIEAITGERQTPEQYSERITAETINKLVIKQGGQEFRSSRAELLLTPTVHRKLKEIAQLNNVSFNELVNQILQDYIERGE